MKVGVQPAKLKETKWHEYLERFAFGGLVTALTGWIAHRYGPVTDGLFLAFPAIFPASVTLVFQHKKREQKREGEHSHQLAIREAGVDAAGAALGATGLLAFGAVVWALAALLPAWEVLPLAFLAWAIVAPSAWTARQMVSRLRCEGQQQRHRRGYGQSQTKVGSRQ